MPASQFKRFRSCDRGAVAIVFALLLSVLLLFVGLAIDLARAMHVRQVVQDGLDAASLAAAKYFQEPGISEDEVEQAAERFFFAGVKNGVPHQAVLKNFKATAVRASGTVTATVDIDLPTTFTKAGGSVGSLEMRPGAKSAYNETKLEVVLVLDVTGSMNLPAPDGYIKLDTLKKAAKDFTDAIYAGTVRPGYIRVAMVPYSASVNAGSYSSVGGIGTDTCVVERPGFEAYTDAPPDGLNKLGRADITAYPYYSCPGPEVVPLADLFSASARNSFKAKIDGLTGSGATAGHIGAAWGWYLLSNRWSSVWGGQAGVATGSNVRKIVVFLTDGEFNVSYKNGGESLTDVERVDPAVPGSSAYQALRLCDNMKASGLTIYTIGLATAAPTEAMLKTCSGAENFYDANNSSQLLEAFRAIASKLTSLRLTS
ncbi:MAG: VWA domain-containing protein [Hyphomicrobiaceae bacterium]|nr:VWA domain-containing protein [Hyphomicrobiaceae bacterium]